MLEQILTSVIQTYGSFGLLIVMIVQTIIAPIPSEAMIMFAGAIGIAVWKVVVFAGIGTLIGAIIAFWVGRKGGRPVLMKLLGDEWVENLDEWINKHGRRGILITRLIPIIPFDLISYITGVTSLNFRDYFVATFLGVFPRMLILALIGNTAGRVLKFVGVGLELTILLGTIGFIVLIFLDRKGYIGTIKRFVMEKVMRKKLV